MAFELEEGIFSHFNKTSLFIGFDEVGRGAVAGPVVVALTFWAVSETPTSLPWFLDIKDSKLLSPKKRNLVFEKALKDSSFFYKPEETSYLPSLKAPEFCSYDDLDLPLIEQIEEKKAQTTTERKPPCYFHYLGASLGMCSADEIDSFNIWQAVQIAVARAFVPMDIQETALFLVDGHLPLHVPAHLKSLPQILLKQGDSRSLLIGLSSILAKVYRDDIMMKMELPYDYGFLSHKGYGTKKHFEAIQKFGPYPHIHRKSFLSNVC